MRCRIIISRKQCGEKEGSTANVVLKSRCAGGFEAMPAHFVVPHSLVEAAELDGHLIPKNAVVIFMTVEIGRDEEVWKDPMEFKPKRFMSGNARIYCRHKEYVAYYI